MPFVPKVWEEDDPITPAELNRMETGIAGARLYGVVFTPVAQAAGDVLPAGWSRVDTGMGDSGVRVVHNFGSTSYVVFLQSLPSVDYAVFPFTPEREANRFTVQLRKHSDDSLSDLGGGVMFWVARYA